MEEGREEEEVRTTKEEGEGRRALPAAGIIGEMVKRNMILSLERVEAPPFFQAMTKEGSRFEKTKKKKKKKKKKKRKN